MIKIPRYAVVDLETNGGAPGKGRITEIAIYVMEGTRMVDEFVSLINPEQPIPPYISRLTGITNEMVSAAPKFYEVARRVVEVTADAIFVAHNASFDYPFIRKEFESLGYNYEREVLCTVKLSRKIIPGHRSYSLGKLCEDLKIPLFDRHRASGDARATALLLEYLIGQNGGWITSEKELNISGLRPEVRLDSIRLLPHCCGVFFFHNDKGEVIYIGKSKNIYKRVWFLLLAKGKRSQDIKSQLADITFEETGSELLALLKEMDEINRLNPLFNKKGRQTRPFWGVFNYVDRNGYERFFLQQVNGQVVKPLDTFASRDKARDVLYGWADKYQLCHRLSGLEETTGSCFSYSLKNCNGACIGLEAPQAYNRRVAKMKHDLLFDSPSFVLFDEGRNETESSFVWIQDQALRGYGWIEKDQSLLDPSQLEDFIVGGDDSRDARQLLRSWLRQQEPGKIKLFKYK